MFFPSSSFFGSYQDHLRISSKNYVPFEEVKSAVKGGEVTGDAWLCPLPDPFSQLAMIFGLSMLIVHFAMIV